MEVKGFSEAESKNEDIKQVNGKVLIWIHAPVCKRELLDYAYMQLIGMKISPPTFTPNHKALNI